MPAARRPQLDDRRRLVIYSQRFSADAPAQAKRAQAADAVLRGARKPAAAYGWRVQRRLRARWYGIVPVRRRALFAVVVSVAALIALVALGHWASLWWPPVALLPELARPLRLDRPDSFGTWLGAVMMATAAGISLMVYQLRRYRADDYRGHYRLWRIALVLCLLSSVDAVIDLVGWGGAAIDVALAERDVLAGADWVRLLLAVGGAAFGLRMTVELARCRTAAATMVLALALLGLSPAAHWNLLRLDAATAVTWLPVALVAGRGLFLIAVVIYLRMLYREVRNLDSGDRLGQRLRTLVQWRSRLLRRRGRSAEEGASDDQAAPSETPPRRAKKPAVAESTENADPRRAQETRGKSKRADAQASAEAADRADEAEQGSPRERRKLGWPFRRRRKAAAEGGDSQPPTEAADEAEQGEPRVRRKLGWPFRRRRKAAAEGGDSQPHIEAADEAEQGSPRERRKLGWPFRRRRNAAAEGGDSQTPIEAADEAEQGSPRERRKLGWPFRRRRNAAAEVAEDAPGRDGEAEDKPVNNAEKTRAAAKDESNGNDSDLDPEGIDWETLNKSERRRAKKLLKRQGKAA